MYINVGAYVDEGTMVDSHALVGNCGIYEGAIIRSGAVLAPGVIVTLGTAVFDLVRDRVSRREGVRPLEIPEGAVVVPGSRPVKQGVGAREGISLYAPVIVKHRDDRRTRRRNRRICCAGAATPGCFSPL
jgi:2,3,4,5-tetrahydropyridine-2-carboxylate N-succinyltransferase